MGLRDLFRRHGAVATGDTSSPVSVDRPAPGGVEESPESADAPAVLRSFPLKLAVMQPLMYEPGAVLPAFTMPASLHPGDPVADWFRGFVLTRDQLSTVSVLHLSRAGEIYRQLDPRWPADDDRFDITELRMSDLALLSGLVEVSDPEGMLGADARATLTERGVRVV